MAITLGSTAGEGNTINYVPFDSFEGLEDVQRYSEGGFHPVHLGEVLDGRFEVVHKLGHGGFGVVWLCLDTRSKRWRAVKILAADRSVSGGDCEAMQHLRDRAASTELEENHISLTLETFWIDGPNGRHFCSVMEVLGSTVADWCGGHDPLNPNTALAVKKVCRQIAKGVQFLHCHGICHGDLRPLNVLMRLKGIDELDKTQLLELLGEPERFAVEVAEGSDPGEHAPEYCVQPPSGSFETLCTDSVAIIDFGEAFHIDSPPRATGIPISYAAPENLLLVAAGFGCDIWSLACTICELRTDSNLFAEFYNFGTLKAFEVVMG